MIFNGDLLHERVGTTVDCLLMVHEELGKFSVPVYWVRGNHELTVYSKPHHTVMSLFDGVCSTVIDPRILRVPAGAIYFLPWYPADQYKHRARILAKESLLDSGTKVLVSHIGLNEGSPTASNTRVECGVSLSDLYPNSYDTVLLGDFHRRQYLRRNAMYLGCPHSHAHGDDVSNGIVLYDMIRKELSYVAMPEETKLPRHISLTYNSPTDFSEVDPEDFTRIHCPASLAELVRERYPYPRVKVIPVNQPNVRSGATARRVNSLRASTDDILLALMKSKGWGGEFLEMARDAVGEAERVK